MNTLKKTYLNYKLKKSCLYLDKDKIAYYLKKGANPNYYSFWKSITLFDYVLLMGDLELIDIFFNHGFIFNFPNNYHHLISSSTNINNFKHILKKNINPIDETFLMTMFSKENIDVLNLIQERFDLPDWSFDLMINMGKDNVLYNALKNEKEIKMKYKYFDKLSLDKQKELLTLKI